MALGPAMPTWRSAEQCWAARAHHPHNVLVLPPRTLRSGFDLDVERFLITQISEIHLLPPRWSPLTLLSHLAVTLPLTTSLNPLSDPYYSTLSPFPQSAGSLLSTTSQLHRTSHGHLPTSTCLLCIQCCASPGGGVEGRSQENRCKNCPGP